MNGDKKLIYFLVVWIIFFAIILLIKITRAPKYDTRVYEEIYDEYKEIFGEDDDIDIQNIQENNNIAVGNNNQTVGAVYKIPSSSGQGNVIGKIIIPKIDIKYPIIKETTTEYLKVALTKYCGPEVNEKRKFSYSRS